MTPRLRAAAGYAVFLALCAAGLDLAFGAVAKSRTQASFRIAHPYFHHGLRPGTDTETVWGDRRYAMRTDALGFRSAGGGAEVAAVPPGRRTVLIGDSMIEGLGVAYPQTAAGLLADRGRARGVEVSNAAAVSYSPKLYELRTRWLVEREGLRFDRLVVFLDLSDVQDEVHYEAFAPREPGGLRALASAWRRRSLLAQLLDRHLFERSAIDNRFRRDADLDVWMKTVDAYLKPKGNPDAGRWEWTYDEAAYRAFGARGLALAQEHMASLARFAREQAIELVIVVYPSPYQIFANERTGRQTETWRAFAEREGVGFLDLFPAFVDPERLPALAAYERYFIPDDVHWNEAGHAFVADLVEEAVLGPSRP
jgi:hypothetical protein